MNPWLALVLVAVAFFAGWMAGSDFRPPKRKQFAAPSAPTRSGHRPGVGDARVNGERGWEPFCSCGWKGTKTLSQVEALRESVEHGKTP